MLSKITLMTSFLFAVTYPACLLTSYKKPIGHYFHRFHLGLPAIVAVLIAVFMKRPEGVLFPIILFWTLTLFSVTYINWKKEDTNFASVIFTTLVGLLTFCFWFVMNFEVSHLFYLSIVLTGGFIFSLSLYTMNLGHFYLNVHGLPLIHLRRATYAFIFFLALRLIWDVVMFFTNSVLYAGELYVLWKFALTLEGGFLWVALLFGTLLPLGCSYMVLETLRLKNTQAATGILYVLLCGVLLGDIAYKYYLITYSIFM